MSYTFPSAPSTSVPGVYPANTVTNGNLVPVNDLVVIVAQSTSSGSAIDGAVVRVFDDADANLSCGSGSPAAIAANAAFTANPNVNLSILCIKDATSGAAATATIYVNSVPSVAETDTIIIDDVQIPFTYVPNGTDTVTNVAIDIYEAINAYSTSIPCLALIPDGPSITLNAKTTGVWGNAINVSIVTDATNISLESGFSSGSGSVNLGNYQTPGTYANTLATIPHSVIINALGDSSNTANISQILAFRAGPLEQNYAVQIQAFNDNVFSSASALSTFAANINDPRTSVGYIAYATSGSIPKTSGPNLSAAFGALIPTSSGITVNYPYDGLILTGVAAPSYTDYFNGSEQNYLIINGVTPLITKPGNQVVICRAVSTSNDSNFLDTNEIRIIDYVDSQIVSGVKNNFQRVTLTSRVLNSIASNIFNTTVSLEQVGILQNTGTYKSSIVATLDPVNLGQVDVTVPVSIVGGLHVIILNININI